MIATAWAILSSKFSGSEEVGLGQGNSDTDVGAGVVVSVARDCSVGSVVDHVASAACVGKGCKLWQLSLQLPAGCATGSSSMTTQVLIVEAETCMWTLAELDAYEGHAQHAAAHLVLVVSPSDAGVNVELLTRSNMTTSATRRQRLFRQFSHVVEALDSATLTAAAVVGDLALVSAWDMADIERWNAKPVSAVADCVHLAIERQTREGPSAEAVHAWDGRLSYGELSRASDRLAKRLVALSVGPEVLVPICFEKSVWAVVAMLAILKAGGACVPLDPHHPRSRHQAILHDIDASVIVSSESYRDVACALRGNVIVVSQAALDGLDDLDDDDDLSRGSVGPGNAAFAVFTSGSTGQPKGIIIEHGAMCTSAHHHGRVMRFGKQTRTLQFAAYTFDDSFSDIFTTLMFGGCICVPSDHDRFNDLATSIARMEANHACLTVTVAAQLCPLDVPSLKTLVVGGESVTPSVVQLWAEHVYLINSYGPAEASIFCSANSGLSPADDAINIGVGVGCRLHITDVEDHNSLVPVGAIGELLIEGPILARQYLGNEAKTNQSFIHSPAWASASPGLGPPRRFYKTGDLARYDEDGTIQVLGRKDTQVKIHGQRVELRDIEHHMRNQMSNCKEVAVEVLTPKTSRAALVVAFLTLADDDDSDSGISDTNAKSIKVIQGLPDGAAERLRHVLPSYMIPSACIKLHEMPLMVSGKLDRKALSAMASQMTMQELLLTDEPDNLSSPSTQQEKTLQALWAQVLPVDGASSIKLESSFFRLGGDSVAAMKLVTAARHAGVKITVQQIFQHATLREQSAVIDFAQTATSGLEIVERFGLLDDTDNLVMGAAVRAISCHDSGLDKDAILDVYPCSPLQGGVSIRSHKPDIFFVPQCC